MLGEGAELGARVGAVLLYHGSSSPSAVVAEMALAERVGALGGRIVGVELSHLSGGDDELSLAIQALLLKDVGSIVVVPMFLAPGGHVQRDVPALVARARARFPDTPVGLSEIIGSSDRLAGAVGELIVASVASLRER